MNSSPSGSSERGGETGATRAKKIGDVGEGLQTWPTDQELLLALSETLYLCCLSNHVQPQLSIIYHEAIWPGRKIAISNVIFSPTLCVCLQDTPEDGMCLKIDILPFLKMFKTSCVLLILTLCF